jgi:hypothetical protein
VVFWAAFRCNMLPPSSGPNCEDTSMLEMETACVSETLATAYKTTRKHNPGDHSLNIYHLEIRQHLCVYISGEFIFVKLDVTA